MTMNKTTEIMKNKYEGSISVICESCGSKTITVNNNTSHAKCSARQHEYTGGYNELVRHNQFRINVSVEKMNKEIIKDAQKNFEKILKNAFRGNKFFKLK